MPRVIIPPPYRGATHGLAEVSVPGDTISHCLSDVVSRYHDLGELVFALDGSLQPFVNVFLNGEKLSKEDALDIKLTQGDVIEIISAIAGG